MPIKPEHVLKNVIVGGDIRGRRQRTPTWADIWAEAETPSAAVQTSEQLTGVKAKRVAGIPGLHLNHPAAFMRMLVQVYRQKEVNLGIARKTGRRKVGLRREAA